MIATAYHVPRAVLLAYTQSVSAPAPRKGLSALFDSRRLREVR